MHKANLSIDPQESPFSSSASVSNRGSMTHTTYGTSEEHGPAKRVSSFGKKLLAGSVVLCLVAAGTAVIGLSSTGEREGQRAEELTARVRQGMLMGEDGASPMHGDRQWDDFGSYKEVSTRCQQNTIPSTLLC